MAGLKNAIEHNAAVAETQEVEIDMASFRCPSCGSMDVADGILQSTGAIHFRPAGVKFLTFRTADIAVRAHMCASCGLILMTGDVEKLSSMQIGNGLQEVSAVKA